MVQLISHNLPWIINIKFEIVFIFSLKNIMEVDQKNAKNYSLDDLIKADKSGKGGKSAGNR